MKGLRWYGVPRKLTHRILATSVGTQGVAVFLWAIVAYQLGRADGHGAPAALLWGGIAVALLSFVTAGMLRRPYGITLGWVVQLACLLMAFAVPLMLVVELFFGALWVISLVQGDKIDDLREDAAAKYAAYEAEHGSLPTDPPTASRG